MAGAEVFTDAVGAVHPRGAWYMAGWDDDLAPGALHAISILGEPLVLFRTSGGIAAFEDRCPHRAAPLSLGRCEGETLRCMYHGVRFAADGSCVEIPGQDTLPAQLKVRIYPAAERHSALWVWMGDPALADDATIPPFVGHRDPAWALGTGRVDYDAPARLIHDNLLDLTHISYVHAESFAGGSQASADGWLGARVDTRSHDRGVTVERSMPGMPPNPAGGGGAAENADVWSCYDFLIPGVFIQTTERYPPGTMDPAAPARCPEANQFSTFTCQAVTPLTADTTSYFWAFGPQAAHADRQDFFVALGARAFAEDKRMIEAQWRTMRATGTRVMPLAMDKALFKYDAALKRFLGEAQRQRETQAA
jgi:phenylpropionate dioxygenase-like ring-hydroxylating dioxygenase large terminal subunit